jgi:hypothetical protein
MFLKNATCTYGGADHSDEIDNLKITPAVTTTGFEPISGNNKSESTEKWTATFNLAQDFTEGSLWMKLFAGGEPEEVVFKPRGAEAGGAVITCTVVPAPAEAGGGVGVLSASATLAVNGRPVITPASAPA